MYKNHGRKYIITSLVIIVTVIFLLKLFYLQVINVEYKLKGESISRKDIIKEAPRGLIYDRTGELVVNNNSSFDLKIIPREVENLDTLELCEILEITPEELKKKLKKARKSSRHYFKQSTLYKNLSTQMYIRLKERMYKYPGFYIEASELREYNYSSASHSIGYIKEVNDNELEKDEYYRPGDYIGKIGVEQVYEEHLRGEKGVEYFLQDNKQKISGRYEDGEYDKKTIAGSNITLSLDMALQEYGSMLMQNKKGGIVAIEPETGEILAKISSPNFDLNKLYGAEGGKYYAELSRDKAKPLFDRTLLAQYPPGSIFKLVNALIGLQEGIIYKRYRKSCYGGTYLGNFKMKCHQHISPVDVVGAVKHSCNAFYANFFVDFMTHDKFVSQRNAYEIWYNYVLSFGFGDKLGADFSNELSGIIPSLAYYDKKLKTENWHAMNIVSVSIGQGELLITPLQMANMVAIIANRGYYYVPHVVKGVSRKQIDTKFKEKHLVNIEKMHFETVIEGMSRVVKSGTGTLAAIGDIEVCGKTGTVQIPGGKDDHSVFVAFAPRENPQIALVVYVENGVWGGRYAAPIAGLMIEKYLKGDITGANRKWLESRMMNANLIGSDEE